MSGRGWTLASTSGRETARWVVTGDAGAAAGLTCDVHLEGHYLGETLGGRAEREPDFALVLRGLEIPRRDLDRLSAHLDAWLALPPYAVADPGSGLRCGMGALFDQRLDLAIGARDDVLAAGRPVATLTYAVGRLRGDLTLIVDHGGLTRFAAGIAAALGDARARGARSAG